MNYHDKFYKKRLRRKNWSPEIEVSNDDGEKKRQYEAQKAKADKMQLTDLRVRAQANLINSQIFSGRNTNANKVL